MLPAMLTGTSYGNGVASPSDIAIFAVDPIAPENPRIATVKPGDSLEIHPSYFALVPFWRFWRISYDGGPAYKNAVDAYGEPVFVPHEREQGDVYRKDPNTGLMVQVEGAKQDVPGVARRKRLSVFKNYCRPGVDRYNDFAFNRGHIDRDTAHGMFAAWSSDVDMLGTSFHELLSTAMIDAQVLGRAYIGIQTNRRPEQGVLTVEQADAAGVRAYLDRICPVQVINWRRSRGALTECVVMYEGGRAIHWTPEYWIEYVLDADSTTVTGVNGPFPHKFGRLPVVELMPFGGPSQIVDVAELNKQLYNLDSLHRSELYQTHFTQFYITGAKREQLSNPTLGNSQFLVIPNDSAKIGSIGGDVDQANSIRLAMQDDVAEIYRLFGLRSGDPTDTSSPASGVSKAWDFHEIQGKVAAIAGSAERAENAIIEMWSAGLGQAMPVLSRYPREFAIPDLAAELARALDLVSSPQIPKALKVKEVERLAKALFPNLTAAELAEIIAESDDTLDQPSADDIASALADQRTLLDGGAAPDDGASPQE